MTYIARRYISLAAQALVAAKAEEIKWDASLGGAGMACFFTCEEQDNAIEGSRLKRDMAANTVKFLEAILKANP